MSYTAAIILCGGQGRRMGEPKPFVQFGDSNLLLKVVAQVTQACRPVLLVGRDQATLSVQLGNPSLQVLQDREPGLGPLEGLIVGLSALQGQADFAFVCGCDTPFLRPALIQHLIDMAKARGVRGLMPSDGKRHYPLCSIYSTGLVEDLSSLQLHTPRLQAIVEIPGIELIPVDDLRRFDPELESLLNINSPAQLLSAREKLNQQGRRTDQDFPQ